MRKTKLIFVIFILLLGTIFITNAFSVEVDYDELLVEPDPDNPFQGTWIAKISGLTYIHVINGMKGEWYMYSTRSSKWEKRASYTIIPKNDGFVTSTNWNISVTDSKDGEILTVVKNKYKRYVHK
jgi:hypothetical protein